MIPYHPIRALPPAKDMNPRPRRGDETDGEDVKETLLLLLDPTKRGSGAGVSYETWLPQAQRQLELKSTRTARTKRRRQKKKRGGRREERSGERKGEKREERGARRRGAQGSAMNKDNASPRSLQMEVSLIKTGRTPPQLPLAVPTIPIPPTP